MIRDVEAAEDEVDDAAEAIVGDMERSELDACPSCGEPAEHLGACVVCHEEGCLPPDLWTPGQQDPCLTLCVRCAREVHLACAVEDEAGNPRCPTCRY